MLTKASLALITTLVLASASNAIAAHKNRFDFDASNSTFPTATDKGFIDLIEGLAAVMQRSSDHRSE